MKYFENKTFNIVTYGCQMNVHESEKIRALLESMDMSYTDDTMGADVVVFNTCCIREGAEDRAFSNIMNLKKSKKINPDKIVVICGCMTQQDHPKYDPLSDIKVADIILGTYNIHRLPEYLSQYVVTRERIIDTSDLVENIELDSTRDDKVNAYVNIIYGCNNFCTYCIVPYVRGRERSRKMTDILSEVRALVSKGYKYITLLGQNVNSYGKDLNDGSNFAKLLQACCQIKGDFKIKYMTSHPKDLSDDVIEVLSHPKMAKAMHLPVQSGCDTVLKRMNRQYDTAHYKNIIYKVRKKVPDISISTDIIVGFPGETEEDFMHTYDLIRDARYNQIFAFIYSKRSGTPASEYTDQVPYKTKNERVNRLLRLHKTITAEINTEYVGKIYNCLVMSENLALTDGGKDIVLEHSNANALTFRDILITRYENKKLYGTPIK